MFGGSGQNEERRRARGGHAVVEVALMAPWIFLLFMGIFDFGFYAYSVIAVENAARVAVAFTSSGGADNSSGACGYVVRELQSLVNMPAITACVCGPGATCTEGPVKIQATQTVGAACPEGVNLAECTTVTVTYTTPQLFPIPGLAGQFTITRRAEARVRKG